MGGACCGLARAPGPVEEGRVLPCSSGWKVREPLSDRPGLPWAKLVAVWPGRICAIWPVLKSETSTCPRSTLTLVLAAFTVTLKMRALHHCGQIGRLDLEMLDVALLDLEQDRTGLLQDRGRHPVLLLGRQAD